MYERTPTYTMPPHADGTTFLAVMAASFFVLASGLFWAGWVPDPTVPQVDAASTTSEAASSTASEQVELPRSDIPVRIVVSSVGINAPVSTPASTDSDVLDRALLSGAVQYPGSGMAGEPGNMLLFGHSSYLPIVHNKAYQTFNELGKITVGTSIAVYSTTHRYEYVVDTVREAQASDVTVRFDADRPLLTLSTCNTFASKEDRWVVTAHFVSATPLQ
jgi:LPXTG-site transpeptidase (sortase) family protein